MTDLTPPPLQGPSSKERKYDRQLRLWAASGQVALEDSNVLLINSGPGVVGVETLKNLVLPGIGQFTILDPSTVSHADIGVNFFLKDDDIGKSRAECCAYWVQELNPDVKSHFIPQNFEDFVNAPNTLDPFTLILAILPLAPDVLERIAQHSQDFNVPAFYIHSMGFYSHFTLQLPTAFPIVDTHPDPASVIDLRITQPWPELLEFSKVKTENMPEMSGEEHGHIPYALLLLSALEKWKVSNNGQVPTNYKEKTGFREFLKTHARTDNSEGGEENFDEAIAAVLKTLNPPAPSSAIRDIFAADECQNLTKDSANFWVIAHAVQSFYNAYNILPLSGGIPDMKAKPNDYVKLQNIFKSKARQDVADVHERVKALEVQLSRRIPIDLKEVEAYCKCAGYVKLIRGRRPHLAKAKSHLQWKDRARSAANSLQDPDSLILIYIAFIACDGLSLEKRINDASAEDLDDISQQVLHSAGAIVDRLVEEAGHSMEEDNYSEIKERLRHVVEELVRAKGGELHNISALTGGMIAQEAIKVITKQYIPVDNTCIFDGILSKTSVLKL